MVLTNDIIMVSRTKGVDLTITKNKDVSIPLLNQRKEGCLLSLLYFILELIEDKITIQ